jgi:hypothetical protein
MYSLHSLFELKLIDMGKQGRRSRRRRRKKEEEEEEKREDDSREMKNVPR